MQSFSTHAAADRRRRNLVRVSTVTVGVLTSTCIAAPASFATGATTPSVFFVPSTQTLKAGGPPGAFQVYVVNNDTANSESLDHLYLATACLVPASGAQTPSPSPATGPCPTGDGPQGLMINGLSEDPSTTGTCGSPTSLTMASGLTDTNIVAQIGGVTLPKGGFCLFDISASSPASPANSTVFCLASADTVEGDVDSAPAQVESTQVTLFPAPTAPTGPGGAY